MCVRICRLCQAECMKAFRIRPIEQVSQMCELKIKKCETAKRNIEEKNETKEIQICVIRGNMCCDLASNEKDKKGKIN